MKNNKKHGYGRMIYLDGTRFEGIFQDDLYEGLGILYRSDGSISSSGNYKKGNLFT